MILCKSSVFILFINDSSEGWKRQQALFCYICSMLNYFAILSMCQAVVAHDLAHKKYIRKNEGICSFGCDPRWPLWV